MEQSIIQFLMSMMKFLAPRRHLFIRILQILTVLVILGWVATFAYATQNLDVVFEPAYEVGRRFGQIGIILYVLTLVPGIITRLRFRPALTQPIASIILPFRRNLGVLMFVLIYVHMSFTSSMAYLIEHNGDVSGLILAPFQLMGSFAWWSLFPLWLTSNDLSVKKLGKWWKIIHKLTYLALFLIFMHVALQRASWMYLMAVVGIVEVASWVAYWRRPKAGPVVATQAVPQPESQHTTPPVSVN